MSMIRVKLADVMGLKKMSNLSEVARQAGINRLTVRALYNESAKGVQWETLNGLCRALDVQPGELLEFVPD